MVLVERLFDCFVLTQSAQRTQRRREKQIPRPPRRTRNDQTGEHGNGYWMQLDRTQRGWAIGSLGIFAAAVTVYLFEIWISPFGARGGSAIGLFFGVVGFGFMIFAAALGARKRVPTWRLGRAKAWMKGHLWLGLLSLPLILFHGGFHFGGTLTRALMWLLIVTVGSGIFGAILQHYLPTIMTRNVPLETIYDEIGHVHSLLREEADRSVEAICGPLGFTRSSPEDASRA